MNRPDDFTPAMQAAADAELLSLSKGESDLLAINVAIVDGLPADNVRRTIEAYYCYFYLDAKLAEAGYVADMRQYLCFCNHRDLSAEIEGFWPATLRRLDGAQKFYQWCKAWKNSALPQ